MLVGPLERRAARSRPRRRAGPRPRSAPRSRRPSAASWSCRSRDGPSRVKNSPARDVEVHVAHGREVAEALGDAAQARRSGALVALPSGPPGSCWPASYGRTGVPQVANGRKRLVLRLYETYNACPIVSPCSCPCRRSIAPIPLSEASSRTKRGERMATTPQAVDEPHSRSAQRAPGEGRAPPLDALHPHGRVRPGPRDPDHRARRGLLRLRRARQPLPGRPVRAVLRERRPRPRGARRGGRAPGQGARLLHELELRPPARDRAGRAHRRARARRPQPRLLHLRRLRGGRVGLEAGAPVPQAHAATRSAQDHRARDRLPRHHLRGARRSPGITPLRTPFEPLVPGALPRAEHEQLPLARGPRPALGRRRRSST